MQSVAFTTIAMTIFFCGVFWVFSKLFRYIIEGIVFAGFDKDIAKETLKNLSFRQRLFVSYAKRYISPENRHLRVVMWLTISYYLHAVIVLMLIVLAWCEFIIEVAFGRTIDSSAYLMGLTISYDSLLDFMLYSSIFGVPAVSLIIGLLMYFFNKITVG